ncbi:MAG: hypothetical protein UY48_C0006G0023 [Candidatus Gottesmanbacteria bacterium GW2011_GWB1_49_7]|uniref:Uncharacterized protein n=1 Tax=Candidatus Gottesmanbacteria bacterium GW2011_GWB1_49_7 TaxID=1618448 RepID=A0A0G1W302_9BACT|nr:MAG: hypothetical protein UY48_C0006G0023 [Candidatus Gottesmanbacteria bacterium GW2011_GWB1_49_7]
MEVTDERKVYVVHHNIGMPEAYPGTYVAMCLIEATAIRLARGKGPQGANDDISHACAKLIDGTWYAPITLLKPTDEDTRHQNHKDSVAAVMAKARAAGLTSEEISLLKSEGLTK